MGEVVETTAAEVDEVTATLDAESTADATPAEDVAPAEQAEAADAQEPYAGPVAAVDVGVGLSTTFVSVGVPSPTLRLGGRYVLPWLEGRFSVGAAPLSAPAVNAPVVRAKAYSSSTPASSVTAGAPFSNANS